MSKIDGFEKFCGSRFWDENLTWYNEHPDFTTCFQNTVLIWVPCGFLWLTLPFYASHLLSVRSPIIPLNNLNVSKTIVGILLCVVLWLEIMLGLSDLASGKSPPLVVYVTPAIHLGTFILATLLIQVERFKGFVTSGILFIFLLLEVVAGIIPFYSKILNTVNNDGVVDDLRRFVLFYIYYAMILVQFVLTNFADRPPRSPKYMDPNLCPELKASFLSRITFWWLNKLVFTSYKKELQEEDVFSPNPQNTTPICGPAFARAWRKELAAHESHPHNIQTSRSRNRNAADEHSRLDERTPLINNTEPEPEIVIKDGRRLSTPSLLKVLIITYGPALFLSWTCKLVYDALQFASPILLSQLIEYAGDMTIESWKGYIYAVSFFLVAAIQSVFFHQLFYIGMNVGMRIKAAIIAAIYQKALTMSNVARKDATVGEVVNLMSVDAQRIQDVTGYLWMVWSAPLQIFVAMWLLWNELGPSVLAGVGIMILLFPLNGVIAGLSRKFQIKQMKLKDQRLKLINELFNGIKVLKLYAWEESFQDKVDAIRAEELRMLKYAAYLSSITTFSWTCAPFLVTLASFGLFVTISGETLTPRKAFTSLSLFNILRFPMNLLPMLITYLVTASVSVQRIGKFLQHKDLDESSVSHDKDARHPIEVGNGNFSWGEEPVLKNVNIQIPDGSLVAVVGQVGAGKSSLLSALLGEMEKSSGRVNVRGSVAYVAQQAWIQNATLRNNILFGEDYDTAKYDTIVEACALGPDLKILPAGDETEIGEKGINLSGGQKQRVSLARAVYADSDIYLLDDPLSAVDSHVGKHIFDQVIGSAGILAKKTRVLVTHGLHWLPFVDHVICMTDGRITEQGSFEELIGHNGPFAELIKIHLSQTEGEDEDSDPEIIEIKQKILQRATSIQTETEDTIEGELGKNRRLSSPSRKQLIRSISKEDTFELKKDKNTNKDVLIEDEKRESGKVKLSVFVMYLTALRLPVLLPCLVLFLGFQAMAIWSNIWLSQWSTDTLLNNASVPTNSSEYINRRDYYLGVYGAFGAAQAFFVFFYALGFALCTILASRRLHFVMLSNILRSPMSFFDTTPIGRIVNRLSRDIEVIDTILPGTFRSFLSTSFSVISTIIIIVYSTPLFFAIILPLGVLYYFIQRIYIPTSRQLKRIESTTRSPIYVHFSETLNGVSTIRAFGYQQRFIQESEEKVDKNLNYYFANIASNRWLGYRLEFLSSLIVFGSAMFAVTGRGTPGWEGLVGLSVTYALQITGALNFMVRMTSELEMNIVSVERILEYSKTPTEDDWERDNLILSPTWPDQGTVKFQQYSTRYRQGLDLVLKDATFQIYGGEKVGIVGRTGAGKSSLTLCLFRIIEAAGGRIVIDGVDIATLGLHQLRKKLTILPQDPVLFSGTLRMNLDPFDEYSDAFLWEALQQSHLHTFVSGKPEGLYYECGEGGLNLSVGQRQLICLARALLRKTKILVLDEATAAVDLETDDLIQTTIRTEFAQCTVLTIAHRLNTIMDNDRVMVLDKGDIKEFASPASLLQDKTSLFYGMAKDAGLV